MPGSTRPAAGPAIDAAELEAIRKAAPFPPVPSDMPGDPVILILRMNYNPPARRALRASGEVGRQRLTHGRRHHRHVAVVGMVEAHDDIACAAAEGRDLGRA